MNAGCKRNRFRRKFHHYLLESFRRIRDANLCGGNLFREIWRHIHGRGSRIAQLPDVLWIAEKRDFARNCLGQGCSASDLLRRIADQLAAGHGGKLLECEGHRFQSSASVSLVCAIRKPEARATLIFQLPFSFAGKSTLTCVPCGVDSPSTRPWWSKTVRLTIGSPSPIPRALVVTKGEKILSLDRKSTRLNSS